MSYTPTNWQTGDTITAAGLNKMEQGIAKSGAFIITATPDATLEGYTLNKTLQEIHEAQQGGQICRLYIENVLVNVLYTEYNDYGDTYDIYFDYTLTFSGLGSTNPVLKVREYYLEDPVVKLVDHTFSLTPAEAPK